MPKSELCNGRLVRHYRQQLKLTQLQLAVRAGVSERVVRKAENGEPLREETLEALSNALQCKGTRLHAADLVCEPLAIAQAYMRSYLKHGADSARLSEQLFAPDVVMAIHADAANLAFAGEFHGIAGIERMIRNAYSQFTPVNEDFGRWSANGPRVMALCKEVLRATGREPGPLLDTWILHEYTITKGVISRIDNWIDSLAWSRFIEPTSEHAGRGRSADAVDNEAALNPAKLARGQNLAGQRKPNRS